MFLGDPLPSITWYKDGETIRSSTKIRRGRFLQNDLWIENVKREQFGHSYTCKAKNNDIIPPSQTKVVIDMLRKFI